ncbi:M35 family metallo-endopeptidase [Ralstonia sp. 25C]|uniref:M35 family metallo-endopeptidase n=1 Tax=Ralstonia sp. 25C TaxID=3447363 RepID=UPI003F7519C9
MANYELIHDTATTNTVPESKVPVPVNTARICPNYSNAEFRKLVMKLRGAAVILINDRIADVARWDNAAKERAEFWFGRADDALRLKLRDGLPKLASSMKELVPENIIRWDEQEQRNITCSVVPDSGMNDAAVCKPDSARRIIAIYSHFCTLDDVFVADKCKLKALIHECSHYVDTFNSDDVVYGHGHGLSIWARTSVEQAHKNADNIACYVAHYEDMREFRARGIWVE